MADFLTELMKVAQETWNKQDVSTLLQYLESGDAKRLKTLKQGKYASYSVLWTQDALQFLPHPAQLSEREARCLFALGELECAHLPAERWLVHHVQAENPDSDSMQPFVNALGDGTEGRRRAAVATMQKLGHCLELADGQPNSAGRLLLSLSQDEVASAVAGVNEPNDALKFLLRHNAPFVEKVAPAFLVRPTQYGPFLDHEIAAILLDFDFATYEPLVAAQMRASEEQGHRFLTSLQLARRNDSYHIEARKLTQEVLADENWCSLGEKGCAWLVERYGAGGLPEICQYLQHRDHPYMTVTVLGHVVEALGTAAKPAVVAAAENPEPQLRLAATEQLIAWNASEDHDTLLAVCRHGLQDNIADTALKFVRLAASWDFAALEEEYWQLLQHKSKSVRFAAARALGTRSPAAIPRGTELLLAKKAVTRSAAVALLAACQTPAADKALEARLDDESDEEVRDQMLLALEQSWEKQGRKITRAEIERRIERTADKLKEPVAKWINEKKLPELRFAGKKGEKLLPQAVRYLLYRQSRAKEMRADVEAKPLYALIDRKSSGDFALALLQQFLVGPQAAEDRWALAVAGLLGDDRCVNVLMQQIRKWVDSNRGKLAEYAAQALALLGTDVALTAVDSLSIRYRSKQKNIGKAAGEAFAEAAERLGMTPDELGDRVVPWLGFEPSGVRLIEQGDNKIEARISLDHKLEFRDLAKGKKIGTLPAGIPAEIKTEFKDLAATIREVVKGQLVRIENLMVRQYRWPIDRWRELYLAHPLLLPFACRMIWGVYDERGKLVQAFRALEDRSLTDEQDRAIELPKSGQIGLVHALDLTPEQRQAWGIHLADYNIRSPILQIERPVIRPQPDEQPLKMSGKYKGTDLNGMTFKGRAERLGWQRGAVVDAGSISSYRKTFAGAGADAVLEVDGMFIGMGMEDTVKLGRFYFIKSGSVTFGSYTYDEPGDEKDARLIAFGDAPPIVYSETLGDLGRIAGTKEETAE